MAMPNPNSPEMLSEEILALAQRECGEILRRAEAEAAAILASAAAEVEKNRREKLALARAEAARRSDLLLASILVETGRLRSAHLETILESIREDARRELLTRNSDGLELVATLAAEAVRRMPGADFVLLVSAADLAAFGDKLAGEIGRRTGRAPLNLSVSADPAMAGGVVVRDAAGLRIWDNRLLPRLERLWPELRRQIAARTLPAETPATPGGAA
jgi:vacuolar-type H+-ATPase subunit E/Vma4